MDLAAAQHPLQFIDDFDACRQVADALGGLDQHRVRLRGGRRRFGAGQRRGRLRRGGEVRRKRERCRPGVCLRRRFGNRHGRRRRARFRGGRGRHRRFGRFDGFGRLRLGRGRWERLERIGFQARFQRRGNAQLRLRKFSLEEENGMHGERSGQADPEGPSDGARSQVAAALARRVHFSL
ncbi:hypothetical protein F8A87_13220 [Betaproteobacteria bacterium SCN2]|nr:hypothetical protein F8A87_13220 [Betaproteobacteria bacterium SCN2]